MNKIYIFLYSIIILTIGNICLAYGTIGLIKTLGFAINGGLVGVLVGLLSDETIKTTGDEK